MAVGLSSYGSPGIVFNTDAEQVQDYPLDPYRILAGDDTYGGNVRPVVVPNSYFYLNLFMAGSSRVAESVITTGATVRVFGLLPREQKQDRAYPHDVSSTAFPDLSAIASGGNWWVPLLPEGATSGSGTTLNAGEDMVGKYGSRYIIQSAPISWYLAGTRRILVTVSSAGAVDVASSSTTTEGEQLACVAGYFSG
jgi:hypothetical protein